MYAAAGQLLQYTLLIMEFHGAVTHSLVSSIAYLLVQDRVIVLPLVSHLKTGERQAMWKAMCCDITRQA